MASKREASTVAPAADCYKSTDTSASCTACPPPNEPAPSNHASRSGRAAQLSNNALSLAIALLASSCCLVQLALNALSLGCAGFSVLTPYAPALSMLLVAQAFFQLKLYGWRNVWTWSVLTLSLCIWASPHLVRSYNQDLLPSQGSNPNTQPICTQQYTAVYQVDGLKCEGCALALKQAVSQLKADGQVSGQQSWQEQSLDRGYGKPEVTAVRVDFPQKRLEVDYTLAGDCSNGPKQQEPSIGMSGQPAESGAQGGAVDHVCSECLFVEGAVVARAEAQLDVLASLNKEQTLLPARARNPRVVLLQRYQNVV